jgi:nucleoid-associated protein YgaU
MRRNETVLVYAVTGLLIVILAIAVIFGEESAQAKKSEEGTRVATGNGKGLIESDPNKFGIKPVEKVPPVTPPQVAKDPPKPKEDPPKPDPKETVKKGEKTDEKTDEKKDDQVAPVPLVTRSIAEQVNRLLGTSQREGDYRVVTARSDDRLSTLVERWCGSLEALPVVEALNEDLKQGKPIPRGRKVLVPWTDDEVLLVAHKERNKRLEKVEASKGELYTIKKGDSLWKIAVGRVGSRQAPAYIKAIVTSNPQLEDPNAVREGQKIRLPPPAKLPPLESKG